MAAMTMVEGIEIGLKEIAEVASNHNAKIKESNRFKLLLRLSDETDGTKRRRNNFRYEFEFQTTFFLIVRKRLFEIQIHNESYFSFLFSKTDEVTSLVRFLVARVQDPIMF